MSLPRKTRTAIYKSPAYGILHFHELKKEMLINFHNGGKKTCRRFCSWWPEEKLRESSTETRNEKVSLISQLMEAKLCQEQKNTDQILSDEQSTKDHDQKACSA